MNKLIITGIVAAIALTACKFPGVKPDGPLDNGPKVAIDAANFPDDVFRKFLMEQSYGRDGVLTQKEIKGVTYLRLRNMNVRSLKGIEHFTNLYTLLVNSNDLGTLTLPPMEQLTSLHCQCCGLTMLDVTACTRLTELQCFGNKLETIDLRGQKSLKILAANDNGMKRLDLNDCISLESANLANNKLTKIDLHACTKLDALSIKGNAMTKAQMDEFARLLPKAAQVIRPVPASRLPTLVIDKNRLTEQQKQTMTQKGWYLEE